MNAYHRKPWASAQRLIRRAAGKDLPSGSLKAERTRATDPRQRTQIWGQICLRSPTCLRSDSLGDAYLW